ncbi:MAG: hypothetical protein AB7P49_18145, partial [Bdellovibrionales bacterium]
NQHRSTFSDLHFQAFHNGRFLVEILNWAGSHVNVHDHDFSGVQFQLKGSSLNVVYDFTPQEQVGALRFGTLKVRRAEFWRQGDRSVVRHGDLDPHGVFHLSHPTTSLLIRTVPTPRLGSQSNYFPTLSAHYYVNNDVQRKKLTGLALLAEHSYADFQSHLEQFLASQSLAENFFMLLKLGDLILSERSAPILARYAERGTRESSVVKSVIYNTGIDFFKTRASFTLGVSATERLVASMIAATHSLDEFKVTVSALETVGTALPLRATLNSFLSKLSEGDQHRARNYLDLFGLEEFVRE